MRNQSGFTFLKITFRKAPRNKIRGGMRFSNWPYLRTINNLLMSALEAISSLNVMRCEWVIFGIFCIKIYFITDFLSHRNQLKKYCARVRE